MDTATCPNPDILADYVLGKLAEADLSGVGSHVAACSACQSYLETLDGLTDSVVACLRGSIAEEADADESLLNELLAKVELIRSESNTPYHDQSQEPVLPQQIGQYRLLEKVGQGSMGAVYKAFHTKLKRPVAIKLLPSYSQRSPSAVLRFQREMEAVGRLDHPNIVRAYDAGEDAGQSYLVMEFVDGGNVSSLVRSGGPLEVADACEIVRQAAIGLQHSHEHGLVHRDVKPSNLMLATSGVIKVLDLGLARLQAETWSDGEATASGQIIGSPDYMAPEQGSDPRTADARADIYALGCTLYFLLAGRPPFSRKGHDTLLRKVAAHANEEALPIQQLRPDVPDQVATILDKMLAKNPVDRSSTAEVIQSLTPFCVGNDLGRLFTNRRVIPPAIQAETDLPWLPPQETQPKLLKASAARAKASRHKVWRIGLGLLVLVTVVLWYGFSPVLQQRAGTAQPSRQNPTAMELARLPAVRGDAQREGPPKSLDRPPKPDLGAKDYIVLHPMQPTVVGVAPNRRVGFPNTLQVAFDSETPRLLVPESIVASGTINITRLFFCREDYVPMVQNPKCFDSRKVNLWVPVSGGPYAQAVSQAEDKTQESRQLRPTRPLSDGVYCLHTGVLADSKSLPDFCCPFIVRGYGIPEIEKAVAEVRASDVKLTLLVRNTGLGEFNDGFVVATIQKQAGSRFEFQGRRHIDIKPIPAKGQGTIESVWNTADWKPGQYHFHGAINYEQLWDANTLATFDTDTFVIGAPLQAGNANAPLTKASLQKSSHSLTANLRYSMDMERWQVNYYRPQILNLSEFPVDKRWIEPPAGGAKRLYGILRFGDATKLNLIVDLSDQEKSTVRVAFDEDVRFDDKPRRSLRATAFGGVEFTVSYPDGSSQPYAVRMYYPFEVSRVIGGHGLHYYRACLREGAIAVDGKEYAIAVIDDASHGDYSDLENTKVMIGVDKNSKVQDRMMVPARAPFKLGDNFYAVSEVTPDGSRITLKEAQRGELRGMILDQQTQKGIRGATVLCSPSGLSTTTDFDGHFSLLLPEGEFYLVTIKADGYVPLHQEDKFTITGGKTMSIGGQLQPVSAARKGKVRLHVGDSYHFLARRMYENEYRGGDFYLGSSPDGSKFWANNAYQGGLVDVGDTKSTPLEQVVPPSGGYNHFGVTASVGHTYVSLAKGGEEGHYVIFRVTALGDDKSVEIEYYYR